MILRLLGKGQHAIAVIASTVGDVCLHVVIVSAPWVRDNMQLPSLLLPLGTFVCALMSCCLCAGNPPLVATVKGAYRPRCATIATSGIGVLGLSVGDDKIGNNFGGLPPLQSLPNSCCMTCGSALRSSASWARDDARLPSSPPLSGPFVCASSLLLLCHCCASNPPLVTTVKGVGRPCHAAIAPQRPASLDQLSATTTSVVLPLP
jgi:hypothetical protein